MSPTQRTGNRLALAILVVLGLVAGIGLGLVLGWVVWPVSYVNTTLADLSIADKEKYLVLVAAGYAANHDLERAQARLDRLGLANVVQRLADLTERSIAEGRNEAEIRVLAELTHALGASTVQMAAYLDTPAATATPTALALPYSLIETRLLTIDENLGCDGKQSLWVQVRDAMGNALDGVAVCTYRAVQAGQPSACQLSGGPGSGWVEFPAYRSGEQVYLATDTSGQTHLSGLSPALSSQEPEIPPQWLVAAGYCQDEQDCRQKSAENALCRGHYSYQLTFQRAW